MTNEEWLRNASTEELARFLQNVAFDGAKCHNDIFNSSWEEEIARWMKWLKEKHNDT